MKRPVPKPYVRWLTRADLPEVIKIDRLSHSPAWTPREFLKALRNRTIVGYVLTIDSVVLGYTLIDMRPKYIRVLRMAVTPAERLQGFGRLMLERIKMKVGIQRKECVIADVWEYNDAGILFLKHCGFEGNSVLRGEFQDGDDGYRMLFVVRAGVEING